MKNYTVNICPNCARRHYTFPSRCWREVNLFPTLSGRLIDEMSEYIKNHKSYKFWLNEKWIKTARIISSKLL